MSYYEGDQHYSHHYQKFLKSHILCIIKGILICYIIKSFYCRFSPWQRAIKQIMKDLFEELAGKDIVTVSWWAEGIDEQCHRLSIEKKYLQFVFYDGVFAYYLSHEKRIIWGYIVAHGGLLLSEFRLKEKPCSLYFPSEE